jgi:hypothetical protein
MAKKRWKWCEGKDMHCHGCGGVYGVGFVGAAVYYVQQATGFWSGILGLVKALVWPAFLVYELMRYLVM